MDDRCAQNVKNELKNVKNEQPLEAVAKWRIIYPMSSEEIRKRFLNKFSGFSFLAIPLTTQPHEGSWYVPFDFKERRQYAVLSQGRSLSVYRLTRRIGTLSRADYEAVKEGYRRLIFKEK